MTLAGTGGNTQASNLVMGDGVRGIGLAPDRRGVGDLTYDGESTVSTAAGDPPVIALTSTAASLTDLQLHVPCTAVPDLGTGLATDAEAAPGSIADAPDGLTVYATSVVATGPAGPIAWTPASPPPAAQLGDVGLTDLAIEFAGIEAPSLSVPGFRQATRFCAP